MAIITTEEIKSLERTRQQLYQLSNSLTQLRFDLENRGDPLPSWYYVSSMEKRHPN